MILLTTWQVWTVTILCALGVGGFLLRNYVDMYYSFRAGYGPGTKRALRQSLVWLGACLVVALLLLRIWSPCKQKGAPAQQGQPESLGGVMIYPHRTPAPTPTPTNPYYWIHA